MFLKKLDILEMAFEAYLCKDKNKAKPVAEYLAQAKSILEGSEVEIERLVNGFVSGLITKAQLNTRKEKLDAKMAKQTEEVDEFTAEI